jgi:hypothetical protein
MTRRRKQCFHTLCLLVAKLLLVNWKIDQHSRPFVEDRRTVVVQENKITMLLHMQPFLSIWKHFLNTLYTSSYLNYLRSMISSWTIRNYLESQDSRSLHVRFFHGLFNNIVSVSKPVCRRVRWEDDHEWHVRIWNMLWPVSRRIFRFSRRVV